MTSRIDTVIETPRLILRVPSLEEFEPWAKFMGDEEAAEEFEPWAKFMGDEEAARYIGKTQPPAVVWRGICTMAGAWLVHGYAMFSVFEKSTGKWVGRVGPWQPHQWPGAEVGWGVIREVWGKGYALEAAAAAMDFAVDELGWTDIIHSIHPDNVNSQKLAIRLGSTNRGPGRMPPPYENDPVDLWGQTAREWKAQRTGVWSRLNR